MLDNRGHAVQAGTDDRRCVAAQVSETSARSNRPRSDTRPAHRPTPDRPLGARERLRDAGLRITKPRVAVLDTLEAHPHSPVDRLVRLVGEQIGSVSTQAVYDVLAACTAAGLVRRIEPAGSPALFETRTDDNHHHLICRRCGHTEDVDCAVEERPCLLPQDGAGFVVDEAEVMFWGLCPGCRNPHRLAGWPHLQARH